MVSPFSIALLGGSFNPPHIGHFRLAHEVMEQLGIKTVLFIPCAIPPHKPAHDLLPFDLRVEMLEAYTRRHRGMEVCTIENERSGPSYTIDTVRALAARYPENSLHFIMGSEDIPTLPQWNNWQQLFAEVNIIALPRTCGAEADFVNTICTLWPDARPESCPGNPHCTLMRLPSGRTALYLPQPILDVRSTLLRELFLEGRNLELLLPDDVLAVATTHRDTLCRYWVEPDTPATPDF